MFRFTLDGENVEAEGGSTVLEVSRGRGISIPTLCYHPALKPSGSCKLCVVEVISRGGHPVTMLSCALKVKDGMSITTQSDLVNKARARAFRDLLHMAPQATVIRKMAEEYGVDLEPPPDGCIRCRLCVRVCKEIVGAGALKMERRHDRNLVVPAENLCIGCGTCVNICPTGVIHLEDRDGVRTLSIRDEVIGRHILERCEACGRLFATQKFITHTRERTLLHPDVKEHHLYCPTCAKLFSGRITSLSPLKPA
jgi:bidirectional [NiFe] hydrogenase diaphorase subunit